jgi:hypothetical protein
MAAPLIVCGLDPYFVRIEAGGFRAVSKMLLAR